MNIKLSNYGYIKWISYYSDLERYGIIGYLDKLLEYSLDCSRLYKGQQIITTDSCSYEEFLEEFYRTHAKLTNYIVANEYYDKLKRLHEKNLEFEKEFRSKKEQEEKPKKSKAKTPKIKDEFVRHITSDLFTGETLYTYDNCKTGESIVSKDPNLLEQLNNKPKKEKVKKHIDIKNIHLTFDFNKI